MRFKDIKSEVPQKKVIVDLRMHVSELGQAHRNVLWPCILHRVSLTQAVLRPEAQCVLILEGAPEHPSGP